MIVGGKSYDLVIDTGSSDTWLLASDFQCIDEDGNATTQNVCRKPGATLYTPGKEFCRIPNCQCLPRRV